MLHKKQLEPGKDVYVFGFDNGPLATNLNPPLASIGPSGMTLGQKALEMLIDQMDGKEVRSRKIPTHLFGRESLMYDMYEFTAREMLSADNSFIDRFFDNCFYRYRNEVISQGAINLKRLFFEILSRMLKSMRSRVMSEEEYREISRMIGILFDNGIMLYTDPNRFVYDFSRLRGTMNEALKANNVTAMNNRLFMLMKDKAIQFNGVRKRVENGRYSTGRNKIQEFMTWTTNYGTPGEEALEYLIRQMNRIGLVNAAMYLYREPIPYSDDDAIQLPKQCSCAAFSGTESFLRFRRTEENALSLKSTAGTNFRSKSWDMFPIRCSAESIFSECLSAARTEGCSKSGNS